MQEPPPVEELLEELAAFAAETATALAPPGIDWHCCPGEGEWALNEVVCHLRDVEREVHQPRFRALMESDGAFLPGAVADEWVEEREYRKQHGPAALQAFLRAREETIALLPKAGDALWSRQGQHSFFGPTSMHELLFLLVQHDRAHREQIEMLLSLPDDA